MQEEVKVEKVELKIPSTLNALIEALIFAAKEPLSLNQIKSIYQADNHNNSTRHIELEEIKQIISNLNKSYEKSEKPYRIIEIAGGYQFATLSIYAEWLGKLFKEQSRRKLSQSGIETLAIIAYKQPVTKTEVENIRGVNCDYVLKTLLEKELITVTGRAESVGRPLLYGTTKEFLKHFGLNTITDLPKPREIEEILGESQYEIERRMLEAQTAAEKLQKEEENFKSRLPHIPKKKSELEQKEVELHQIKKIRQIKILPSEEQKLIEQAGQEKIKFNHEVEKSELEVTGTDGLDIRTAEQDIPSEIGVETSQYTNNEKAGLVEKSENVGRTANELPNKEVEIINSSTENIENSQFDTSKKLDSKHPNRWQAWKEKISRFIKKLFV